MYLLFILITVLNLHCTIPAEIWKLVLALMSKEVPLCFGDVMHSLQQSFVMAFQSIPAVKHRSSTG